MLLGSFGSPTILRGTSTTINNGNLIVGNEITLASGSGNITASGDISASGTIISDIAYYKKIYDGTTPTETDTYIEFGGSTNHVDIYSATRKQINVQYRTIRINDSGNDVDFYVEGDTDPYLIHTDASTDRVGIGILNPLSKLDVAGDLKISSDITASGDISASGDIKANILYSKENKAAEWNGTEMLLGSFG